MKTKIYIAAQNNSGLPLDQYRITVRILTPRIIPIPGTDMKIGDIIIDKNFVAFEVLSLFTSQLDVTGEKRDDIGVIVERIYGSGSPAVAYDIDPDTLKTTLITKQDKVAMIYEVNDSGLSILPDGLSAVDYDGLMRHRNTVHNIDNLRANTGIGDAGMNTIQNTDKIYLPVMENELITTEFDEDFIFETNITSTDWTELWTYTVDISEIDPAKYNKSVKSMFGYFRLHGNVANPGETAELKVIVLDNDELTQNDVTNIFTVDSTDVMDWIRSGTMKFTESLVMPFKLRVVGRITSGSGTLTASISNQTNVDLTYVVDKI